MPEDVAADSKSEIGTNRRDLRSLFRLFLQLFHLALSAVILLTGFAEFIAEPTIFDVFGTRRSAIPRDVFEVRPCTLALVFEICQNIAPQHGQ